ncbi:tail fiber assembly protein [Escherichia coli]|uniref:tail fiber assembly protein n=1 Tax=Escherichia coli TaxID=562 RepID=UPI003F7780BF|nr:tail fiber assembly protein [Escherichia coli]
MKYYIFEANNVGVSYNDEIPEGAIECDVGVYTDSRGYSIQDGMLVSPTDDEIAEIQHEDEVATAEQKKKQLIISAMNSINVIQLKLQSGRQLTDAEKNKLDSTLDYIDAVEGVDTNNPKDIVWPSL